MRVHFTRLNVALTTVRAVSREHSPVALFGDYRARLLDGSVMKGQLQLMINPDVGRRRVEVLLVEDNPGDVRLTQEAFKEGQFMVNLTVAMDGVQAIDILNHRGPYSETPRPDLILLDLNLPKKSGREVLGEIKTDDDLKRIPVIVMTTSKAAQDIHRVYELNANCYITKPVELDEFLNVVRSIEDFWLTTVTLPQN